MFRWTQDIERELSATYDADDPSLSSLLIGAAKIQDIDEKKITSRHSYRIHVFRYAIK